MQDKTYKIDLNICVIEFKETSLLYFSKLTISEYFIYLVYNGLQIFVYVIFKFFQ